MPAGIFFSRALSLVKSQLVEFFGENTSATQLRNKYHGRTALVLGNGPSLNSCSPELLNKYVTFGTNGVFLKHVPDIYLSVSAKFVEENWTAIEALPSKHKFVARHCRELLPENSSVRTVPSERVAYGRFRGLSLPVPYRFSYRPDRMIYLGGTVLFACIELAAFMGFSRIILIGVDHNYGIPGHGQIYGGTQIQFGDRDPHHFAQYWKPNSTLHSDLHASNRAFSLALKACRRRGIQLLNATPGSGLRSVPTTSPDLL